MDSLLPYPWPLPSVRPAMSTHVSGNVRIVITHVTLISAGLSADVTVLMPDVSLQPLLSDELEGAVVTAQREPNCCTGRGAGSAERLLALWRRRLLGALSRLLPDLERVKDLRVLW